MTPVYKLSDARSLTGTATYYSSMLAGNDAYSPIPPSSYDLLETEILTGSVASVTFSNLNSTYGADYQHLQIRMSANTTSGAPARVAVMRFGSGASDDSGSNYSEHILYGTGTSALSSYAATQTEIELTNFIAHSGDTDGSGSAVIDILDAFSGSKYKTVRALGGNTEQAYVFLESGLWQSTSAINRITIGVGGSFNLSFGSGSRLSLYGLKGA